MPLFGLDSTACLTLLQQTLSDVTNQRWSQATLLNFIDRANKRLVRDVWFPDSRIIQPTTINQQAYQMPLIIKLNAVYVAGQLAVPTDVATLEGRQLWKWDDTAADGSTPLAGSDAPFGTVGPQSPQWVAQEPLSYPDASGGIWQSPAPDTQEWQQGQRPRYFMRGGYLVLVPAPANVVDINVDCVRQPDTITAIDQAMTSPENFLEGIVWGAVEFALFGDRDPQAASFLQIAAQNREREKRKLVEWRWEYQGEQRKGPKPDVLRYRTPGTRLNKRGRC